MHELLDNVVWHALDGSQAACGLGPPQARRFAPGYSALAGFAEPERPDLAALGAHCAPGEAFYCVGWSGAPFGGWRIAGEKTIVKMVWRGALPDADDSLEAQPLGPGHVPLALELTGRTQPGPFGPRTIELGDYLGCFEDGRLIAMAGERLHAQQLREVSGVCTDPDHRGRGLARRLMLRLVRQQLLRGEVPFLHVMADNPGAQRLYEHMGFATWREMIVRVITAP